jgi:hypothetical protein
LERLLAKRKNLTLALNRGFTHSSILSLVVLLALSFALPALRSAETMKARANQIVGRVTTADGGVITGDVRDITIFINGVSAAGEKVSFSPVVQDDGVYRQRVPDGSYSFGRGQVRLGFNQREFTLPLEAVGRLWDKRREADDGIVQHFVLKLTGPTPYGEQAGLDENNHTHWYGVSIGLAWQSYRSDRRVPTIPPPAGTRLILTCRATSPGIDGRTLAPIVVERVWDPAKITPNSGLNDLPPANYEIVGEAVLPDGRRKPILFQGARVYPNFLPVLSAPLEPGGLVSTYFKLNAGFIIE